MISNILQLLLSEAALSAPSKVHTLKSRTRGDRSIISVRAHQENPKKPEAAIKEAAMERFTLTKLKIASKW